MASRRGKEMPAIRVPTVSFYSHRGTINELEGTTSLSQRKDKSKGPFLMAMDQEGMPILADRVVATYPRNTPMLDITWAKEERDRLTPDQFAAAGYKLDRGLPSPFVWSWELPASVLVFPTQASIIDAQRFLERQIAERFRVTRDRPNAVFLLIHGNPKSKSKPTTPSAPQAPKFSPVLNFTRSGGFLNEDESGEARLQVPYKKDSIEFSFQYGIRGPGPGGLYTYHAAFWPTDESLLGNIPGLPGELFEDAYFLTFLSPPPPVPGRATARGLAENMLRQAVPYIVNAVKAWNGIPLGETPRFYHEEGRIVRRP